MMKEKFVKDYLEADDVCKKITTGEVDIVTGIKILSELIIYTRKDINTLDKDAGSKLTDKIKEFDKVCNSRKEGIKKSYAEPEDTEEERLLKYKLLKEDQIRYRQELFYIQDLAYTKGWFD